MSHNKLFKQLCRLETVLTGWHLAHLDSRDNFVLDPVGYTDFGSTLDERLMHLCEQVQTYRYRPRHLLEIDLPKSGLSVRPGNVLPIEESILLHGITCLLAPILDKNLPGRTAEFHARRVSAITKIFRLRRRRRAAHSPKS